MSFSPLFFEATGFSSQGEKDDQVQPVDRTYPPQDFLREVNKDRWFFNRAGWLFNPLGFYLTYYK
jgi:hypothetical protein